MIGSAFGGVETFESETLKLAAKPDRPKVRIIYHCFAGMNVTKGCTILVPFRCLFVVCFSSICVVSYP
jgi:hypothetical protein